MKILVLTSIYKQESLGTRDKSTSVVNYFVHEWDKQGHDIIVINNSHQYPKLVHKLPNIIRNKINAKLGFEILSYDAVKKTKYSDGDVRVYRLPIKKFIPHSSPGANIIKNQTNKIIDILNKENFQPDVITGHWASPQLEMIYGLKPLLNCKTAIVLHGTNYIESPRFDKNKYLENIDIIGTRSLNQSIKVKRILDLDYLPFVCYSGIPNDYLEKYSLNLDKFENINEWNITFVGRLVGYKNIDSIIKALSTIKTIKWKFNIVGDGGERTALEQLSKDLGCLDKVKFWNKVSRETVMEILKDTHIFTMVSTNEVFGLVYLEAMAASCITIASENGGVDGIIVNEENGFLCPNGDSLELRNILLKIMTLNIEKIRNISSNAYMTVNEYSDSKAAKKYLQNIKESN